MSDTKEVSAENTMRLLEWAIQEGKDGLRWRTDSLMAIKKDASITLAIFLAGAAGGLAYAAKGLDQGTAWMLYGAGAFSAYLFVLCGLLVAKVLVVKAFPALHQIPDVVFQPKWEISRLMREEVKSLSRRINDAIPIINASAQWLNWLRYAAILSPVVLIVAALLAPEPAQALGLGIPAAPAVAPQ